MIIIEPSVEILTPINGLEVLKMIELAGRTCYSDDTEVLTVCGWKFLKDIKQNEQIYTYNINGQLEIEPANLVTKQYYGEMIESVQSQLPFIVTPDHRMFACKKHSRKYKFLPASMLNMKKSRNNLTNRGYRIPKWFHNFENTINPEYTTNIDFTLSVNQGFLPRKDKHFKVKMCDDFLTIIGAYVTEGHIREQKGNGSGITITQTENTELYNLIVSSLNNLKWSYRISEDPRKPTIKFITINGGQPLKEWFKINCGKLSRNKKLPDFFTKLSVRQLAHLLYVLYLGDGSHNTTRTEKYISISKTLLDQVQMIWILLGKNASLSYVPEKSQYNYVEECNRDSWLVRPDHIKIKQYNGYVYCPSTKNGIVCVRRNGHAMWCGNCYKSEHLITDDSCKQFVAMLIKRDHLAMLEHFNITFKIICDRGVTHEIVRHRLSAYAQESTRYVNYNKKGMTVINPCFWQYDCVEDGAPIPNEVRMKNIWYYHMETCERAYNELIALGAKPEEARSVLPNSLKTEIVCTMNLRQIRHVLTLRTSKFAHPQARQVFNMLLEQLKVKVPVVFDDIIGV